MPKISRDILQQFLPNHQAIVAFEQIQGYVEDVGPEEIDKIIEKIGLISEQVTILELLLSRLKNINVTEVNNRLDILESMPRRPENLRDIYSRIAKIETFLGI